MILLKRNAPFSQQDLREVLIAFAQPGRQMAIGRLDVKLKRKKKARAPRRGGSGGTRPLSFATTAWWAGLTNGRQPDGA